MGSTILAIFLEIIVEMKNYSFPITEAYDDFTIKVSKVSIATYKDETLAGVPNQVHDFGLNLAPNYGWMDV